MNLALNALHAMEGTTRPILQVMAGRDAAGVFFAVRDSGPGIPAELLGRIFDPFFTTKGPDKGTGLGLSICHSIVRQLGGEITVGSKSGQGACFTVRLPAKTKLFSDYHPGTPAPFVVETASEDTDRRVLVVEDELVIRNFLKEAMRKLYGCTVDEAADGREALARVSKHDYDLILSDIRMPEMTGPEFYLRLKECRPAQANRLVFVSGHVGQGQLAEDIARWGVPVLAKPFTMARLAKICAPRINEGMAKRVAGVG
jgi:CheY-like chemotaxis protein